MARIPEFGSIQHVINIGFSFPVVANTLPSLRVASNLRLCITNRQTRTMIWHPGSVMMNDYTCKIAKPDNFFIESESADASGDTLINVISPLAVGYPSRSGVGGDYRVLDLVGRSSDPECPNGSYRIRSEFECGDSLVRTVEKLLDLSAIPMVQGTAVSDPGQSSRHPTNGVPKAEGAGPRDLVAVYRTEILSRLLEPICPAAWGGHPVLWPLWADEMVHRTYATIQLTSLLLSQWRREPHAPVRCELDYGVASNLAAAIRQLTILSDGGRMPCSALLRGITRNFVELFGPVAGDITIATRIEPLQLVAFKRRALGLLVIELLSNALLRAFRERDAGHIEVQLAQVSRSRARLIVKNNGRGQTVPIPQRSQQIGADLANLLEAQIVYGMPGFVGTVAQIELPV
jgi:two-component sensor histidine kinase